MASRKILCTPCAEPSKLTDLGIGEGMHVIRGALRQHCVCDLCARELDALEVAFVVTTWREGQGLSWFPWEDEVLLEAPSATSLKRELVRAAGPVMRGGS